MSNIVQNVQGTSQTGGLVSQELLAAITSDNGAPFPIGGLGMSMSTSFPNPSRRSVAWLLTATFVDVGSASDLGGELFIWGFASGGFGQLGQLNKGEAISRAIGSGNDLVYHEVIYNLGFFQDLYLEVRNLEADNELSAVIAPIPGGFAS